MSTTQSPPLAVITPTNHGGFITITAAVGMTFAICATLMRVYARAAINGPWGHDDSVLAVSTLLCVGQSIAKMVAVSNGLGKSISLIDPSTLGAAEKSDYISDMLFIFALYLSKASAVFLYLRLTPSKPHKVFCWSILGTSTLWVVASVLAVALRCELSHPWNILDHCVNIFLRWQVIGAFDIITELALFVMAIDLVRGLRMSFQIKAFVVSAFAFRLPVIAFAALRLRYLKVELFSSDPTFNAVLASIWMQIQQDYSIIASSIPCLKPFMNACNTGWGHAAPHTGEGSMHPSHSGSYALSSIFKSSAKDTVKSYHKPFTPDAKVPGDGICNISSNAEGKSARVVPYHAAEPGPEEAEQSIASNDSQQMIIRREIEWTVTYDDARETPPNHAMHASDIEAQPGFKHIL